MFTVLTPIEGALICPTINPRVDAYRYVAYLRQNGYQYRMLIDEQGNYTVEADGSEPIRYERRKG